MKLSDRARVERAVFTYSSWLDAHAVPARRRRDLRRELRGNLLVAAEHQGARRAVEALGSLRRMASGAGDPEPTRPRWGAGGAVAVIAFVSVMMLGLFAGMLWVDGARAVDPDASASGSLFFFPGSEVAHEPVDEGISFSVSSGPAPLVAAAVAFVLVARPWRVVTGRSGRVARLEPTTAEP